MKKKSAVSAALLCAGLMRCAAALADTAEPQLLPEPDQVMQMGSGLGGVALVVAVLALIVAIALFLISSMNNARLRSEVSALQRLHGATRSASTPPRLRSEVSVFQRRLRETETDRARSGGGADNYDQLAQMSQRMTRIENAVDDLERDFQHLEQYAAQRPAARPAPAQPVYAPPQARPVQQPRPAFAQQNPYAQPVRPTVNAPAQPVRPAAPTADAELARLNQILDGSDAPERLLQKVYSAAERQRVEMLHYVHPAMKAQNQGYADFCAYGRINPGMVSVMRVGKYVVPYRLSLNGSAIADWYDVAREQDGTNPRPHFKILSPAVAAETGENVVNEAGETHRLIRMESKGKLIAYNL